MSTWWEAGVPRARGGVTVRPADGRQWLEHFCLAPHLQGSAARRLYERHGFVVEAQDPVDVFMVRPAGARRASAATATYDRHHGAAERADP